MKKRKGIRTIISLVTVCSMIPIPSVFAEQEEPEPMLIEAESIDMDEEEVGGYRPIAYDLNSIEDAGVSFYSDVPLPVGLASSYDSRNYGYITDVKNQNPYGTCWAFSAINSAESDMIKDGRGELVSTDLSEAQLAYFFYHRVDDPLGGTEGDMVTNTSGDTWLDVGGNGKFTTLALASWYAPVDEDEMPYGQVLNYSSSTVTDSMAYEPGVAHLQNAYWVTGDDRTAIKNLVMEYGSVSVAYFSNSGFYDTASDGSCVYYYPDDISQNHAVSIIGWDDNFPAEEFSVSCTDGNTYVPSIDGAWLVKNSYGTNWGDEGCFWLSYEDGSFLNESNTIVAYDYESADNYDNNYQYDGGVALSQLTYDATSCYNANIFTAQGNEELKAVGFYTTQPGMGYSIQIYKNLGDDTPIGTAALSGAVTGTETYAGYHTVELPTAVSLNKGETYSVVIQFMDASGTTSFMLDQTVNYSWLYTTSEAATGQGYYSYNGSYWTDAATQYGANLRIKAFTDNVSSGSSDDTTVAVTGVELNKSSYTMTEGDTVTLVETVFPTNATNQAVSWSSSDSTVASVDSTGYVRARSAGTATITVKTKDGNYKATCVITVEEPEEEEVSVTGVTLLPETYTMNKGEMTPLIVTVSPVNATNKSVSWSSSNTSVATVSSGGFIQAKQVGTTTITVRTADGGYTDSSVITVVEDTSDTITGMTISTTKVPLRDTRKLNLTVTPASASWSENLEFKSYNTRIATVSSDGVVTGVSPGYTVIQVKTKDGSMSATATVYVYDEIESFVVRLYDKCLGREPDAGGLTYWDQRLVTKQISGTEAAYGFVFSEEYLSKNTSNEEYVEMLYVVFMNRKPDESGLNYWVDYLEQGLSREYVFAGFAHSQEYTKICNSYGIERGTIELKQPRDLNPNLTKFVNRLYVIILERDGEADGLNYYCEQIQSKTMSIEDAAMNFVFSPEFKQRNLGDKEFVTILYKTVMDRLPETEGLNYWMNQMKNGMSREEVLHRFIISPEFQNLRKSFGL